MKLFKFKIQRESLFESETKDLKECNVGTRFSVRLYILTVSFDIGITFWENEEDAE